MYDSYQDESSQQLHHPPSPPAVRRPRLAEAYVPDQQYVKAFPPAEALAQGTLFPELVRPYVPER